MDAEAEVLLNTRSGIVVRGAAAVAAVAARARFRENILWVVIVVRAGKEV